MYLFYTLMAVFVGGGVGSILRWAVCNKLSSYWGTFTVNVIGAFLIGCAYNYFQRHLSDTSFVKLFLMTGLLGGFTTFSTYLLDFSTLLNNEQYKEAFIYLFLSIIVGFLFLILGIKVMSDIV